MQGGQLPAYRMPVGVSVNATGAATNGKCVGVQRLQEESV